MRLPKSLYEFGVFLPLTSIFKVKDFAYRRTKELVMKSCQCQNIVLRIIYAVASTEYVYPLGFARTFLASLKWRPYLKMVPEK